MMKALLADSIKYNIDPYEINLLKGSDLNGNIDVMPVDKKNGEKFDKSLCNEERE